MGWQVKNIYVIDEDQVLIAEVANTKDHFAINEAIYYHDYKNKTSLCMAITASVKIHLMDKE